MDYYKIHVKHGTSEFNAEGPQEVVREDYQRFLDILKSSPSTPLPPPPPGTTNGGEKAVLFSNEPPPKEDLDKIFMQDEIFVSLKYKPATEYSDADGLLLLLYGYKILKNVDQVLSLRLTQSSIKSGLSGAKASLVLGNEENKKFIRAGGSRRAAFYSLSNLGVKKAEELVKAMLAS